MSMRWGRGAWLCSQCAACAQALAHARFLHESHLSSALARKVSDASILCGRGEFWFKQYLPLAECRFPCWVCVSRGAQWVGWFVYVYPGPGGVWRGWGAASVGAIAPLQSQALLAECALSTHARNLPWSSIVWQVSMCLSATEATIVLTCGHQ